MNEKMIGGIQVVQFVSGRISNDLQAARRLDDTNPAIYAGVSAIIEADGTTYATATHPRPDNYGNDIVTTKAMKDWAIYKLPHNAVIHINAETGSDTADLFSGRGLTADRPFKSLEAACAWVRLACSGGTVNFRLHSDITINTGIEIGCQNFAKSRVCSDSTDKKTITITSNGYISSGNGVIFLSNLIFNTQNSPYVLNCNGQCGGPYIYLDAGLKFNGSVSGVVLNISRGGKIIIPHASNATGNITGRKYSVTTTGILIGASMAPGTEAGTCDASSIAA